MSEKKEILILSSPDFGVGKETIGYYAGYTCGYCHGNGWFWNPEIIHERVKIPCPKCGGTGRVKGIVTVEWVPDGEVKTCFGKKQEI